MNRQSRMMIVLAVALVAATVASVAVYRAISRLPVQQVEIATRHAVVASRPMPMGTRITTSDVKVVAWPERTPLPNGFTAINDVVDRGLVGSVVENEPLVESKLAPREAGAGLPPSIPAGMRAMSVRVNEVIGVAGFVVPGTRVDLMVVVGGQRGGDGVARMVSSNVQVLAAGTRYDQEKPKDGKQIPSTVVTLLVSPEDAERIALAQSEGQIMLALRNPMDTAPSTTTGVRMASLLGPSSEQVRAEPKPVVKRPPVEPKVVPEPPPPPPKAYMVETIRAAKRSTEEVGK
jgi:pilus assembly protein CpaB